MGCNFCTTSAFFGGKGKYLNFYNTGDGAVRRDGARWKRKLGVQSFFMMDENFLLHKRRAMQLLDRMKAGRQALVAVRLLLGQRHHASTPCASWWNWASRGSGWAWNRRTPPTPSCKGADTLQADARTAPARHQAAGLHHRRPGTPHAGEHPRRRSSTPSRTIPISTSSCSTRPFPARRCSPR